LRRREQKKPEGQLRWEKKSFDESGSYIRDDRPRREVFLGAEKERMERVSWARNQSKGEKRGRNGRLTFLSRSWRSAPKKRILCDFPQTM